MVSGALGNVALPSDNYWGVPVLDINAQARHVELPLRRWGRETRKSRFFGTFHFYTQDYRFERLWTRPGDFLASGAHGFVEPNFSIHAQTPRFRALWNIGRKRWLARLWQDHGYKAIVDLNVDARFRDIALIGVPRGWQMYATRGSVDRLGDLQEEYDMATEHAGRRPDLFLVYGGGKAVQERCAELGVLWMAEESDEVRRG
jgi:hypothetical protein